MPVFLDTTENMIELVALKVPRAVSLIPPAVYNIGIDGVIMAFRPTEPLRQHGQSRSAEWCSGSWSHGELARMPVQNRSQSSG